MSRIRALLILSCWVILTALTPAQLFSSVTIENTYFNPEHPELIDSLYQNLAYNVYVEFGAPMPDSGCYTTVFWAISSLGPDPIYPTFQVWHLTEDHSHLVVHGQYFYSTGWQHHVMIFAHSGTFIFRFGLVRNLPWEFTTEELWENMASVGIYDEDTLNFN